LILISKLSSFSVFQIRLAFLFQESISIFDISLFKANTFPFFVLFIL
jgi:hypothetical protein